MSLKRLKRSRITHYPGGRVCAALTAAQMTALQAAAKAANVPFSRPARAAPGATGPVLDDGKRPRKTGMGSFFQVLEVVGSEKPRLEAILRPRFPPDPDRSAGGGPFRPR